MRNEEAGRTEERERESRGGGKDEIVFVMCFCEQFVWRIWRSVRYGIGQ
jgi:hypothetical protein